MVLIYAMGGIVVVWLACRIFLPRGKAVFRSLWLYFGSAFGATVAGVVLLFLLVTIGFYLLFPLLLVLIVSAAAWTVFKLKKAKR